MMDRFILDLSHRYSRGVLFSMAMGMNFLAWAVIIFSTIILSKA